MGFGKDIPIEVTARHEKKITLRAEWYLWIYMCYWEIKVNQEYLICSDDEKDAMREALKRLENKKLLNVEMLSAVYDMKLEFEDAITLHLISNNLEEGNEQWMLFTPDKKVLTAGPFEKLSYENED